jgi:hypothetical protein
MMWLKDRLKEKSTQTALAGLLFNALQVIFPAHATLIAALSAVLIAPAVTKG